MNADQASLYKLNTGDVFTLGIEAFSKAPEIWNDPVFFILGIELVRLKHHFRVFGRHLAIPRLKKTWLVRIEYRGIGEGRNADFPGVCSVCGAQGDVAVACSTLGGITNAYCQDCLDSGAEPWGDLVFTCSMNGPYPDAVNEEFRQTVLDTCARLGKTEADFAAAVQAELESEQNIPGQMDLLSEME